MAMMPVRVVHTSIARDWREVYDFASKPENMPRWASGLAGGLTRDGEDWIADGGPLGEIRVRFTPANALGVLDHVVTMPDGTEVHNALRVTPNGDGAVVAFTLLQRPEQDDAAIEADAAHVAKDLKAFKALLEA